ncbi:MAG: nuclear transport factor 2 family protein [Chitinophagales bacterium]
MYLHVFEEFVELINDHDAEGLASLMSGDHKFIDAAGNTFSGKENMVEGWKMYFKTFPDYWIEIETVTEKENEVYGFGWVSATHSGHISGDSNNFFKIPAAFRALIEGEKVKIWQVYADTKLPFDIIEKNKK